MTTAFNEWNAYWIKNSHASFAKAMAYRKWLLSLREEEKKIHCDAMQAHLLSVAK